MRFMLAIVAVWAVMLAPAPSSAINAPIINIGAACQPACANLTIFMGFPCIQCLYASGWFPVWTNVSQPGYTMARMPLYESGLHYVVALPFVFPSAFTQMNMATHLYLARQVYPDLPKNVSVWYIDQNGNNQTATRDMGPPVIRPNNNNTGFCYEGEGWLALDPPCDGHVDPLANIFFNTPEQLVMAGYSTQRGFNESLPSMMTWARQMLTDVQTAADSLWICNAIVWADTLYLVKLGPSDVAEMKSWFGADLDATMVDKINNGELYKMDMATWMQNLTLNIGNKMQPGALALMEKATGSDGKFVLRTTAVVITDPGTGGRNQPHVYTPTKSPSAFIFAMLYARCTLIFHQIRMGHFYHFHMMSSAQHYALYNTIDPGVPSHMSSHPVRMLLDEWTDVLIQQGIQTFTYLGISAPPYVAIQPPSYPQVHDMYVKNGGPLGGEPLDMWGVHPLNLEQRSKIDPSEFTNNTKWDLYEHMKFSTELFTMIYDYNLKVVKAYYDNNKAVRQDKKVQEFVNFMKSPTGSNLGRVNKNNKVTTREELADVTSNIMYKSVIHAYLHLQDFFKKNLNIIANPTRIDFPTLPDSTGNFTLDDMMKLMPNAPSTAEQVFEGFAIAMVSPQGGPWLQKYPGTNTVDYSAALPFPATGHRNMKANNAAIAFRKKIVQYTLDIPLTGYIRQTDINFNFPFEMTTHIDY